MLIKFFPRGRGCGAGSVDYVCGQFDHHGQERIPAPKILYGDADIIRQVIDTVPFKYKYSSGVISFCAEDSPTFEQQEEVMREFESAAFPGMGGNQYSILWVRHSHVNRTELHFVIPRVELTSDKSYNPAPPGWQDRYDLIRDYFNYKYGWARPDDPDRARPLQPGIDALIGADKKRKGQDAELSCKESIAQKILEEAHAGKIHHRKDIIDFLRNEGFSLPRIGKDYITIIDPADGKRHRLKGLLFNEDFCAKDFLNRHPPVNIIDVEKAAHAKKNLDRKLLSVSAYNQTRYPKENTHDRRKISEHEQEAQEFGRTADQGFPILEQRDDRRAVIHEQFDHASKHITGSGRGASGAEAGGVILGHAGRQVSESQDTGRRCQFPASGNDDHQKYTPRAIASIYQKILNALFAEIRSLQSDTAFLQKAAIQKKLKVMPKITPSRKTFASIMQNGLLPHVATLKSMTRDLHHGATRHRLKHMSKIQPRYIDTLIMMQQIAVFCAKRIVPVFDEANSLKIMAQSFIIKKQERQREQQEYIPVTQEHEVICISRDLI